MEKKEKLRKRLYKMVDGFIEVCDLDSEYYLVEKNDYTTKIMEQEVRDMASNIELDKARAEGRRKPDNTVGGCKSLPLVSIGGKV